VLRGFVEGEVLSELAVVSEEQAELDRL